MLIRGTLPNHFDSQNVMFWSEAEQCYLVFARHMVGGKRATARASSCDFLTWSGFTPMTYSDTRSTTPSQHLYTNQTQPYFRAPHIYIALPGRLQAGRRVLTDEQARLVAAHPDGGGASDVADGVFLTSRAGSTLYDFTFRESFVRPGSATALGRRGTTTLHAARFPPGPMRCRSSCSAITGRSRPISSE